MFERAIVAGPCALGKPVASQSPVGQFRYRGRDEHIGGDLPNLRNGITHQQKSTYLATLREKFGRIDPPCAASNLSRRTTFSTGALSSNQRSLCAHRKTQR